MAASNRTNQSSKGNKKNLSQNTNPSSNQNEQEELVSKGGPQWDGVIFNGKIFENCTNPELYKKALNFLATGEYKRISLEMKTCRDPRVEIWGMRVNDTIRFLGTTVPVDGKNYFYVLDVLPNHEYENNSYMEMKYSDMENFKKSPIIQKYVREQLAAAKTEIIKQKPVINIKESVAYIGNKFLQFDHKQTEALNRGTRFIGAGAPSSGKSVIAINLFKNYLKNLEYQNKTPQGLIYYVTQAQDLVDSMQEIWDHSNASNQYQVKFISCENLLKQCYPAMDFIDEKEIKERIRNSINIKKFNIDKNKKYSNKKLFNKDLLSEKIIYEEFRTMEGYTPEEYKKGIGERKSTFGGNDDPDNLLRREYLLEKRKAFMDALKKDGKMHAEFAHLPDDMNIEFGIGDECQDFSPAFIKKFIELTKGNFVFLGDENQNIFWARPVLDYIKKCVRDLNEKNNLKMDLPIIHLPFTHLISKAVKNAANRLLLMMNWLTGGLNHHGQYTEIQTLEYGVKEGKEEWVVLEDGNSYGSLLGTPFLEDLNAKIRNKPLEYLVVIPDKADVAFKALAEKLFPDAIILDIAQAKGQHYKKTIFLGPLDRKEHQNKFEEANAKLKGITPENITISKNLADRNVTTSEEVSNFFTGITRAIEDIIVIQEMRKNDKGQFINNNIINFLKPKKEELKEVKEVTQSIEIANTPVQSTIEIEINNPIEKTEADNTEYHYLDLVDGCKSLYKKSPEEAEKFYNKYIKLKYHPDTTFADFINPPQEIPQSTLAEEQASLININTNANAISADDVIITNETVAEENISQSKKVSANNQRGRRGRGRGGRQTERNAGRTANKSVQKSINEKSSDFATPLRRAIDFGDIAVIKQLLQNPNLDVNNIEYKTADAFSQMHSLEYVINCGNTESFCLLFNDPRIVLSEAQQNDIFNNRDSMEKLKFSMKQILNLLKACTKKGYTRVFETLLHFEQEKDGVHGLLTYISKHEYDKNIIMLILNAITKNHEKTILDLLTKAKQEKNTKLISILEEHLVKVENSFKEAYIKNDLASINHFLKQGKINFSKKYSFPSRHPNAPDVNMPILMKALVNRKLDIFQAFLKAGADVNIFFGEKRTGAVSSLLTLAIEAGVEYAKAVLAVPSLKVNTFNQKGNNTSYTTCALQEACQYACENKDYLPIVNLLLNVPSLDVNLMTKDEYGENTTLSKAVSSKRLDIIALLLTHKDIDVNKMSYNIRTQAYLNPIHLAVIGNNIEAFELLLSKGKNIDINLAINDKCGDTLLHIAIEKNNLEIVKRLLRMPFIDIHKKNKEGLSPLEMAYTSENPEIIRVLQDADKPVKGIGKENPKQTYVVGLLNELYRDNKNYKKSLNNLAINGSICSLLFNDIITINCENTPFNGNLFSHLMNLPPCREKFINYLMTTRIEIGPNPPKNLNHYVKAGQRAIFCLLNMVEAQCKGISLQDVQTQIVHFILANIAEDDLYKLADEAMQMPEAYKIKDLIFSDVRLKNIDKSEGMERAVRLGLKDLLIKGFVPEGHAFDPKIWGPPAILPLVQAGIAAGQDEIVLFLLKDSQMEVKSNDLSSLLSQVIERNKPEIVDALLKLVKPKHGSTLNFLSLYNRAEALQHTEIALMLKQHLITSNSNLFFSAVKQDEVNIASIQIDASTSAVNQNNPS